MPRFRENSLACRWRLHRTQGRCIRGQRMPIQPLQPRQRRQRIHIRRLLLLKLNPHHRLPQIRPKQGLDRPLRAHPRLWIKPPQRVRPPRRGCKLVRQHPTRSQVRHRRRQIRRLKHNHNVRLERDRIRIHRGRFQLTPRPVPAPVHILLIVLRRPVPLQIHLAGIGTHLGRGAVRVHVANHANGGMLKPRRLTQQLRQLVSHSRALRIIPMNAADDVNPPRPATHRRRKDRLAPDRSPDPRPVRSGRHIRQRRRRLRRLRFSRLPRRRDARRRNASRHRKDGQSQRPTQ